MYIEIYPMYHAKFDRHHLLWNFIN